MPPMSFSRARRTVFASLAFAFSLAAALPLHAADKPLRIGLGTSIGNKAVEIAAQQARKQGLEVELVEFSDWRTPNTAVANGEVDVNYFQHRPFLENSNQQAGLNLVPIAPGYTTVIGLYSKKVKRLAELRDGASIAVSADPVNTGRAPQFLQEIGLLQLKPGLGHKATVQDITANPRKLRIVQLEGPQIARAFDDVDAAATYATFAKNGGLSAKGAIVFEKDSTPYAFQWVVRPDRRNDPRILQFISIYQKSPEVRESLTTLYDGVIGFAR
jgi:D-methionine transport system substrate-binding protein